MKLFRNCLKVLKFEKKKSFLNSFSNQITKRFYFKNIKRFQKVDLTPEEDIKDHEAPIHHDIGVPSDREGKIGVGISKDETSTEPMMAIISTCKVCETRSYKQFSKDSYENGVVLIQCPSCKNLHLIADNLNWFQSGKNIEELLAAKGQTVKKVGDVTEIKSEDIIGIKKND
eukprot:gene4281-7617_t